MLFRGGKKRAAVFIETICTGQAEAVFDFQSAILNDVTWAAVPDMMKRILRLEIALGFHVY
jgi:hypothetical protein